jgi:hypothetical protein
VKAVEPVALANDMLGIFWFFFAEFADVLQKFLRMK